MNIENRSAIIINSVLARGSRGVSIAPGVQRISDDPRWYALFTPGQHKEPKTTDPGGSPWDLIQVFVYAQLRLTAHVRGEDIRVRLYRPGPWEAIFIRIDLPVLPPVLPGGHPRGSLAS